MAVNTSWSKDTKNYPPCGRGLLVEYGKAVEMSVTITVASDDDASVGEHNNNHSHYIVFQLFEYLCIFDCLITVFPSSSSRTFARNAISK